MNVAVMSDCMSPYGLYSPWNSPGQNIELGSLALLQAIFPTQGPNPGLPHCRESRDQLSHQGSPEPGQLIWFSHHFKNFPQFVVIHTVKGFIVVNEADLFLEFSCFFDDPTDAGNLISGSSAFSKSSSNIGKFLVHVLLKPSLKDLEHDLASL